MIELACFIVAVAGMLGAFYLGAKKGEEKLINRRYEPADMEIEPDISEEEYMKSIGAWKPDAEETI